MSLITEITHRKDRIRPAPGFKSAFIGRSTILEALSKPSPPASVLIGEMGVGKSRLLAEVRERTPGSRFFTVACQRGAALLPLDPLVSLVRVLHRSGVIPAKTRDAVVGAAETDRLHYIREALESATGRQPICFQIDDFQWADAQTPDALRYCIDRLQDLPARWQLASQPGVSEIDDFAFGLQRANLANVLQVDGLSFEELRQFVSSLNVDAGIDDASISRLFERTAGNPLYADLLLTNPVRDSHDIPRTLRWALHRRIEALTAVAADVAAWISVHRAPMQQGVLAGLSRYSAAQVLAALTELIDRGIVRRTQDGYAFRHELLRDVCYDSMDERERAARHRALADRSDDDWQKAGHLDGAGQHDEAAMLLVRIGWDRLDRDSPTESLAAFERAIHRLHPDSESAWETRAGVACALFGLGRHDEARQAMAEVEGRASSLSPKCRVLVRCRYAEAAWNGAEDMRAALPPLEAAVDEAPAAAPDQLPRLLCLLGATRERSGNLIESKSAIERGLTCCNEATNSRETIRLQSWLGVVTGRQGNAREGIEIVERAANRAEALGLANELAKCATKLCYLCDMIADFERYEYWCRRGLDVAGPKSRRIQALLMMNLAYVAVDKGRLQEALGLCISAASAVQPGDTVATQALCGQANLYAMLGDFGSAERALRDARLQPLTAPWRRAVYFTAGYVAELHESFDRAVVCYDRAVVGDRSIGEVYELRALAGIVRAARGEAKRGRAHDALEQLRAANRLGWPVAQQLVREAEGYWKVMSGDSHRGCADLLAAADASTDRFWQAHLRLMVADARGDREIFFEVIDAFDSLGATWAADRARALARAHGLRPGRKRVAHGGLSDREISVALLVAAGKTNAEIAEVLHISRRTAENHLSAVLGKCGLRSRVEIAIRVAAGTLLERSALADR